MVERRDRLPASGGPDATHTEGIDDRTEGAVGRQFRLRIVDGCDVDAVFEAGARRVVVGTHRAADFVLQDPTLSRFHCELEIHDDRVLIRDLGSLNGTIVDGTLVLEAYLRDGSVLTLGRTSLRFEIGSDDVHVPLSERARIGDMVGQSLAMRAVFAMLEKAARTDATLLLQGETGTGKDLAAEAVHAASERADGPFVVVDCGAIPSDLLESKLFGHRRGAFTGANEDRTGVFEEADGGTLFLDEVGELSVELQPKLLRVLENRELQRIGDNRRIPVDVRVIAATNRNLRKEVNAHTFRSDLYYRLAVVEIALPPLRERADDIPLLVDEILARLQLEDDAAAARLRNPRFMGRLAQHDWPGNVRELRNYIERCVLLGEPTPLEQGARASAESPPIDTSQPLRAARQQWVQLFERQYLERLLEETDGNVSAAARRAGVDRVHMYRLLSRCGLR